MYIQVAFEAMAEHQCFAVISNKNTVSVTFCQLQNVLLLAVISIPQKSNVEQYWQVKMTKRQRINRKFTRLLENILCS